MHIALARKYRPRTFADLIGQEHVARGLRGAVEQNRVAHGYLLCGPRGVGKTTAARVLAMALNCETRHAGGLAGKGGEPCGTCASCQRIWSGGASLDVVEIDAASNRGVDDARDLRERAMYAASQEGRHKVYIVDEAHMLTREAWNTLLKVLEEPPAGVVFVFATTEPHKITNTAAPVMSRLQRFDFRRVGPAAIAERLVAVGAGEGMVLEPDAVELIARLADGGLRDALSVLDQVVAFGKGSVTAARVRDILGLVGDEAFAEIFRIVAARDAGAVFPFVARLVEAGVDIVAFAEGAADLWRAGLAMRLGAKPEGISSTLAEAIRPQAEALAPGDYLRILRTIEESEEAVRRGSSPRITLETLLVRWALMDRTVDIAELLRSGGAAPSSPSSPSSPPASPSRGAVLRDVAPVASPSHASPSLASPSLASPSLALSVESVQSAWPRILEALREARKPIVAEALAGVRIAKVEGDVIVLDAGPDAHMAEESVARNRAVVEAAAGRVLGIAVKIGLVGAEPVASAALTSPSLASPSQVSPSLAPPTRISASTARSERTRAMRGKDPALDGAMDALDLELLE